MDKETLSNYGWIVICVLVLAVMLALATPFGTFVADGFKATYTGLFQTGDNAMDTALGAVGVSNKLPCGHGRKEAGDHSKLGCGHFACEDCGCVPASCGVEGHWSNDGLDHATTVNHSDHTYACQCTGWIVPEGGTYTLSTGVIYNEGKQLPCGYTVVNGDKYNQGDYIYSYKASASITNHVGWQVDINTNVTDKNQETYGVILASINSEPVTNMSYTFRNCTSLTTAPVIPNSITNMYYAFYGCTSLEVAPAIPNSVSDMSATFNNCVALTTAPIIPSSVTNMWATFGYCPSLKTYIGSTDPDGDFSNYIIPDSVTKMNDTFSHCTSLTVAPAIPNGVTKIDYIFWNSTSLVTAPKIPSSVTNISWAFSGCTSLTGTIEIPCTLTKPSYFNCSATITYYHVDGCDGSCGK